MKPILTTILLVLIATSASAQPAPIYLGVTGSTYDGNQSGYYGANALCVAAYTAGARVCTGEDVLKIVARGTAPTTTVGWVSTGPPGDVGGTTNDCEGWTSAAADRYGRSWSWAANATGGEGSLTPCDSTLAYLCCK